MCVTVSKAVCVCDSAEQCVCARACGAGAYMSVCLCVCVSTHNVDQYNKSIFFNVRRVKPSDYEASFFIKRNAFYLFVFLKLAY